MISYEVWGFKAVGQYIEFTLDTAAYTSVTLNFYVGNGFVLVGTFGVAAHDDAACATLATVFPGRTVEPVDARPMFECGGGIHCITQQQPASGT